jgi:hypothetical protein
LYCLNYQIDKNSVNFSFNPITREPLSFSGEIIEAAQLCKEKANGKIVVCFSGGIDSEIVCRALQYVGANFTAITFAYNNWCNHYDVNNAISTCDELGLLKRIINLDIEHFIDYKIDEYHEMGYIGNNIYRFLQIEFIKLAQLYGDYPILCSGEQRFMLKNLTDNQYVNNTNALKYQDNNETGILINAGSTNVLNYINDNKINANPYFLYTSAELMAAYQQIPIVDFSLKQKNFYSSEVMTYEMKIIAYHNTWPNLRWRKKSNGYEGIKSDYIKKYTEKLSNKYKTEPQNFWISLNDLRQQLGII